MAGERRSTGLKRWGKKAAVAVVVVLAASAVTWQIAGADDEESGRQLLLTAQAERQTLRDTVTLSGVLERSEQRTVNAAAEGRVSAPPVDDGSTVDVGDTIVTVAGRAAVAVPGELPFFRQLDVGSEGPDVLRLEQILSDLGHPPGPVDTTYTEETRSALAGWQAEQGYPSAAAEQPETITLALSPGTGYTVGPLSTAAVTIGPGSVAPGGSGSARVVPSVPPRLHGLRSAAASEAAVASEAAAADGPGRRGSAGRPGNGGLAFQVAATDPLVEITTSPVTVAEGAATALSLSLSPAPTADLTVGIAIGGTASPAIDFDAIPVTVVVPAGAATFDVVVTTRTDTAIEPVETILVSLAAGAGYTIGARNATQVTIAAAPGDPVLTARADTAIASEAGVAPPSFTIQASTDPVGDISVNIAFVGTASQGIDYIVPVGTVTLRDTATSVTVPLALRQDDIVELDETVELLVLPGTGYQVGSPDRASMRLVDDDLPTLTLSGGRSIGEGTGARLTVTADARSDDDLQVALTPGGTATVRADYDPLPATVVLPAGQTTVSFDVSTLTDELVERAETIVVGLAPGAGFRLGTTISQTVTIEAASADTATPVLSIRATSQSSIEGQPVTFVVEADRALDDDFDIVLGLGGSAAPGTDADLPAGPVTMAPGQRQVQVIVTVRQDDRVERDETIEVTLEPSPAYRVSSASSARTTVDSEDLPEMSLVGGATLAEGATTTVTVVADQAPVEDTSVNYQALGTAAPGQDFEPLAGTVVLRAGQTSAAVSLRAFDDDVVFLPTDMIVGQWPARIGTVLVDEGQVIAPGAPLFTIIADEFTITLKANPSDRSELIVGQTVDVEISATGQNTTGVITELDTEAELDPTTQAEQYGGTVEIEEALGSVDGAAVRLEVVLAERVDAIVVPIAAVGQDASGADEVRVIDLGAAAFRRVAVTTGLQEGSFIEILTGLEGDEIVVVEVQTP